MRPSVHLTILTRVGVFRSTLTPANVIRDRVCHESVIVPSQLAAGTLRLSGSVLPMQLIHIKANTCDY